MANTALVWFRRDLRLTDNPALLAAVADADTIIPVYIHAPEEEAPWQPGAASNWWLHHSLTALADSLAAADAPLIIRSGNSAETLLELIETTGADSVYWNRLYEPAVIRRDARVRSALEEHNILVNDFNAYLLLEPGSVMNKSAAPYKVFTPFWKAARSMLDVRTPTPPPQLNGTRHSPESLSVDELALLPAIRWDTDFEANWQPGEAGALEQLDQFIDGTVAAYTDDRNRPDRDGTSRLSAHLHFGEVSPHQVAYAAQQAVAQSPGCESGTEVFLSEIGWREFAHHLLVHFPNTVAEPLRPDFKNFPWRMPDDSDPD